MNSLDKIIKIIETSGKPFLYLYIINGFGTGKTNAGHYECETADKEDTTEAKIQSAIYWLKNQVSLFPADTQFSIELKTHKNANGLGVAGPFLFVINEQNVEKAKEEYKSQLASIEEYKKMGFVPIQELDNERLRSDLKLQNLENKNNFERMQSEFQATLDAIQNQQKLFNPDNLSGLVKDVVQGIGMLKGNVSPHENLAGIEEKPLTAKEILIRELAEKLANSNLQVINETNRFADKLNEQINKKTE